MDEQNLISSRVLWGGLVKFHGRDLGSSDRGVIYILFIKPDDLMAWECFPHYWALCAGNPPVTDVLCKVSWNGQFVSYANFPNHSLFYLKWLYVNCTIGYLWLLIIFMRMTKTPCAVIRGPIQYRIRRLILRSRTVSKWRNWCLEVSHLKFSGRIGSTAAEVLANFQSDESL